MRNQMQFLKAYTMVDGVLTYGEIIAVSIENDAITYTFKTMRNKEILLDENAVFYNCEEYFKSNIRLTPNADHFHFKEKVADDGKVIYFVNRWAMVDGEPKEVEVYFLSCTYDDREYKYTYIGKYTHDNTYVFREECLDNNEYLYTDEDGVQHKRVGIMKLTRLTDEQKTLVNQLVELTKELKNKGVYILYDIADDCMGFLNESGLDFVNAMYHSDAEYEGYETRNCDQLPFEWHNINSDRRWDDNCIAYKVKDN